MQKIYTEMTLPEMLREFNGLVPGAVELGLAYRERKCFKDRADGLKSLGAIESSLRAAREAGAASGSPGLARLRASEQGEAIRQQTLADQAGAAAAVHSPTIPPADAAAPAGNTMKVKDIMAKAKKDKAEGNGGGRRGRAPAFADEMKISVLVDGNPKREGSRGHACFGHYRNGMLVKTYVEKVGDRGEAMANLRYDAAKEHISVA